MTFAILNSFLLLFIAIELGLIYIRMGQKK
jgi:hypothetical protein